MSEEIYNSNDYCKLAEEFEELKKENAELARDKDHLMNLFMESSEYVYSVVSNMEINDLRQKCKRLEADYEISNRELLVKQVEITALRAELEAALVHYGKDAALNFPLPQPPEAQESESTSCKFCGSSKSDRRMNSIVCSNCGRKIGNIAPTEVQE